MFMRTPPTTSGFAPAIIRFPPGHNLALTGCAIRDFSSCRVVRRLHFLGRETVISMGGAAGVDARADRAGRPAAADLSPLSPFNRRWTALFPGTAFAAKAARDPS